MVKTGRSVGRMWTNPFGTRRKAFYVRFITSKLHLTCDTETIHPENATEKEQYHRPPYGANRPTQAATQRPMDIIHTRKKLKHRIKISIFFWL